MQWIKVEYELPKDDEKVLVTDGKDIIFANFITWEKGWHFTECCEDDYMSEVTHWAKHPELPKD